MGLFYPTTFGIVGQKMSSLQFRSQGDSEDPHDEHYLLATQSKQDQVKHTHTYRFHWLKPMKPNGSQLFFYLIIFSNSPPNQLQTGKLFPDQVDVWKGRWAVREGLGTCQIYPGAVGVVVEEEGCRGKQSLGLPMESPWWEQERWKSLCLPICPGRRPSWPNLRAKHWD